MLDRNFDDLPDKNTVEITESEYEHLEVESEIFSMEDNSEFGIEQESRHSFHSHYGHDDYNDVVFSRVSHKTQTRITKPSQRLFFKLM